MAEQADQIQQQRLDAVGGELPGSLSAGTSRQAPGAAHPSQSAWVLSAINAIFSEDAINIAGEYLQTDARVGYVVIDVETDERAETVSIRRKLEQVPGTIRTRILY